VRSRSSVWGGVSFLAVAHAARLPRHKPPGIRLSPSPVGAGQGLGRGCPAPGPNPQESPGNQRYLRRGLSSEGPANRPVSGPIGSTLKIVVSSVRFRVSPSPGGGPRGVLDHDPSTLSKTRRYPPVSRRRRAQVPTVPGWRKPCKFASFRAHLRPPQLHRPTAENRGVPGSNPGLAIFVGNPYEYWVYRDSRVLWVLNLEEHDLYRELQ